MSGHELKFHKDAFAMVWPAPRPVPYDVIYGRAYFIGSRAHLFVLLNMPGAE